MKHPNTRTGDGSEEAFRIGAIGHSDMPMIWTKAGGCRLEGGLFQYHYVHYGRYEPGPHWAVESHKTISLATTPGKTDDEHDENKLEQ